MDAGSPLSYGAICYGKADKFPIWDRITRSACEVFQTWPKRKKTLGQSRDILCLSAGLETSQHPPSRSLVSREKEVWAAVLIHQSKHSCKHLTWKRNAGKISLLVFHKCFLLKHLQELLIFNMNGNKWSLIQAVSANCECLDYSVQLLWHWSEAQD